MKQINELNITSEQKQYLNSIVEYAQINNVPIIEEQGLKTILAHLHDRPINSMLEIGTAIGFSALMFNLSLDLKITTIERNPLMYEQAIKNIKQFELEDQITIIHADALEYDDSNLQLFDCLYIDAAKSQYYKFLNKYLPHLKPDGIILFDNLNFHGLVFSEEVKTKSRNLRALVRKLEDFIITIQNDPRFDFELISEGDGIGIATLKGETHE